MKTPEQWQKWWISEGYESSTPPDWFIVAVQSDARAGMVPAAELRPILDWLRTINTPDVSDFLGQLTSLRMREIITRLETLLGEKGGK